MLGGSYLRTYWGSLKEILKFVTVFITVHVTAEYCCHSELQVLKLDIQVSNPHLLIFSFQALYANSNHSRAFRYSYLLLSSLKCRPRSF
jgi:hypothetical protein